MCKSIKTASFQDTNRLVLKTVLLFAIMIISTGFTLESGVVTSGSGILSGGRYEMLGTIAQPAVGPSASSRYQVISGFWAMQIQVFTEPGIPISVEQNQDTIILFWPKSTNNFVIDSTSSLNSPIKWSQIDASLFDIGTNSVAIIPRVTIANYFRLRSIIK